MHPVIDRVYLLPKCTTIYLFSFHTLSLMLYLELSFLSLKLSLASSNDHTMFQLIGPVAQLTTFFFFLSFLLLLSFFLLSQSGFLWVIICLILNLLCTKMNPIKQSAATVPSGIKLFGGLFVLTSI